MKRIAVPSDGERISSHFGHCPNFTIFECDGEKIVEKKVIANPGHKPGFLPKFLNENGVECVLASGMGQRAIQLFEKNGIDTVTGASGLVEDAIESYIKGELDTANNLCDH